LCISYLTIENRGEIPRALRAHIGNRIYGCDICQEVCPWNGEKFVQIASEPAYRARSSNAPPHGTAEAIPGASHPGTDAPALIDLMRMDEAAWDAFSRGSAIRRAGRTGFLRNVAVALGNRGGPESVPVLAAALEREEPLVRAHAAWALGRIGSEPAIAALAARLETEREASVREEIRIALPCPRPP
jgi:epoxyqueuosine reductase